jgi:8-oxo-dGTP diphosphatase
MEDIKKDIHQLFGHKLRLRVSGICIENESILLIKHIGVGKTPFLWAPPGGGLNFGETVTECLKREFLEETGLEIEPKEFLFTNEYLEFPLHAIELFFKVKVIGGKFKKGIDPEMKPESQIIKEIRFVPFEEIKNNETDSFHSLFNNFKKKADFIKNVGFYQNIVRQE